MKITSLKETKAGRVALSVDGEYTASLDMLTVGEYGLCVGDEIDEDTLSEMLRLSQSRRAKSKAVELLSYREHSSSELKRKLLRTATEEDADAAVARMQELGMVDDESFARRYAHELSEVKLYGYMRVKQELMKKGLPREMIEQALEELPDQRELLTRYITQKRITLTGTRSDRDKLARKLISRGFSWDDVSSVLSEFEVTNEE